MSYKRSLMRKLQPFLPKSLRYTIFRERLVIQFYVSKKLQFRPAKTKQELEQAYQILHDSYVENGYMNPHATQMRITKYFTLPTTTTLIALWDNKVIGTATIIKRTSMGLPLETAFNIDHLTQDGSLVGEISSLAIAKEFRNNRGVVFLPFCKYVFEYAKNYLKLQKMMIACHPSWEDMYAGIFCMDYIEKKTVEKYEFAHNNPAIGLYYDTNTTEKKFLDTYSIKPLHKNMYHFFYGYHPDSFHFPETKFNKGSDPTMTPDLFHYFFIERSSVFMNLTEQEKQIIFGLYPKEFSEKFYNYSDQRRKEGRYFVDSVAMTSLSVDKKLHVIDVSKTGMRIRVDQEELEKIKMKPKNEPLSVKIKVNNRLQSKLNTVVQWVDEKNCQVGLSIIGADDIWDDYLSYLNADFQKDQDEVNAKHKNHGAA